MNKNKKVRKDPKNKPTLVAFLLDRTGSMESCKDETIKGFNGYIDSLKDKKADQIVFTLTQFDSIGIDILHDAVPLKSVNRLNADTYQPRAATPLHDAIGMTIRATEKSAGNKYKVLFVTLTDGLENASSEWNSKTIKDLIKEKEDKDHWTFAHIGVGANGWAATSHLAAGTMSASNVLHIDPKDTAKTYARMGNMTRCYMSCTSNVSKSAQNLWAAKHEAE